MSTAEPPSCTTNAEIDIPACFARMKSRRPPTPTEESLRELAAHNPALRRVLGEYARRVLCGTSPEALRDWLVTEITTCTALKK